MPKVSVNILTKNRSVLLKSALDSVGRQSFKDLELIIIDDGSTEETARLLTDLMIERFKGFNPPFPPLSRGGIERGVRIIRHQISLGITKSRQEALMASQGDYIAVLDDDDEWAERDKLKKQVEYLDNHPEYVLVGGGIKISNIKYQISKMRPQTNRQIRKTMLFRNNFFTSTVMFRREAAIKAGGFFKDQDDFAEDYDLWLRLGTLGKMFNFQEVFAAYRQSNYNKLKYQTFLKKQLRLIDRYKNSYPHHWLARLVLKLRLIFTRLD